MNSAAGYLVFYFICVLYILLNSVIPVCVSSTDEREMTCSEFPHSVPPALLIQIDIQC